MKKNILEFNTALLSNVGQVREKNEDNLGEQNTVNGYIVTVCDGMGGHVAGEKASQIAVESILSFLDNEFYELPQNALTEAIKFANSQIIGYAQENPDYRGMGTTTTILLIRNDKIYIAHVGDSRIYLYTDKILHHISKDHSLVQQLVDSGILTEEEAETDRRKNQITKALGIANEVKPSVSPEPILAKKEDLFLLCSDGLSDMVDDININSILSENISIKQKTEKLIELANDAGGKDNISVALVNITKSSHKVTSFDTKSSEKAIEKQKEIFLGNQLEEKQNEADFSTTTNPIGINKQNEANNIFKNKKLIILAAGIALIFLVAIFAFWPTPKQEYKLLEGNKEIASLTDSFKNQPDFINYINKNYPNKQEGVTFYLKSGKNTRYSYRISPKNGEYKLTIKVNGEAWTDVTFKTEKSARQYFKTNIDKTYGNYYCELISIKENKVIDTYKKIYIKKKTKTTHQNESTKENKETPAVDSVPEKTTDNVVETFENGVKIIKENGKKVLNTLGKEGKIPYIEEKELSNHFLGYKGNNKLWGIINNKGNVIVSAQLQEINDYNKNGLLTAKRDTKWGFIDTKGSYLPGHPKYKNIPDFKYGLAAVQTNSGWGIVTEKGTELYIPNENGKFVFFSAPTLTKENSYIKIEAKKKIKRKINLGKNGELITYKYEKNKITKVKTEKINIK